MGGRVGGGKVGVGGREGLEEGRGNSESFPHNFGSCSVHCLEGNFNNFVTKFIKI